MSDPTAETKAPATTPPEPMREACRQGLSLWAEHGRSLAKSAKRRAENLAAGQPITANMLGRLRTFFAKHAPHAEVSEAGRVEILLAGGEPGRAWVDALCRASAAALPAVARGAPPPKPAPKPPPAPARPPAEAVRKDRVRSKKRLSRKLARAAAAPASGPAEAAAAGRTRPAPAPAKTAKKASNSRFADQVYGQEPSGAERIAKTTRDMLKRFLEGGRSP